MECESIAGTDRISIGGNCCVNGNIKFEKVTFSYIENEPVLKNINIEIKAGEKVAIIGSD